MRGFRPVGAGYEAVLDDAEREVLARAALDVAQMLAPAAAGEAPQDPAVARLVPDASDDDEVAAEFRRLTQDDVAAGKVAGLERFAEVVRRPAGHGAAPVLVERAEGQVFATALTDLRLVLADRLDLVSDEQVEALHEDLERAVRAESAGADGDDAGAEPSDGGLRRFLAGVFVTAGWLQESLVEAMLADLRRGAR